MRDGSAREAAAMGAPDGGLAGAHPYLLRAEDKRFYDHGGVDWLR
jgi:hypothetical protein